MKKYLSVILLLAVVFGLIGCTPAGEETAGEPTEFSVGYHTVNITPEERVALGGYSNPKFRTLENIIDDMYATQLLFLMVRVIR